MESPLRPPPSGFVSNFDNPEFLGTPVVVTAGVCLPLIFLFAFIRIYARALVKKWTLQDYMFCLSCFVGVGFIAFSIPLTLAKPYGYHVWDIDARQLTKTSMIRIRISSLILGPVLWFTKVSMFWFLLRIFRDVRWFRTSAYFSIIATGLVYSGYTITVTMACAPRPGADKESYIAGFRRDSCSSSSGINMIVSLIAGLVNSLTDLYLVAAALILNSTLHVTAREMRGVYLIHLSGSIACVCGFLGVVYRIKSWQDADITGYQIPLNVAIIIEIALSLMIPCMPSIYTIWAHYTYIDINERGTIIGSPSTGFDSTLSYYKKSPSKHSSPTLPPEATFAWRKKHTSIEELPFRKPSAEFYRGSTLTERDSRMKALPTTPLPFYSPMSPKTPKTPNSVRSMQLPIILEAPYERSSSVPF
ncbi:hypothetical protein K458DRAFT_372755 [Lentithecium fluviatile CBS 122367]|uniref:Rhodopsin domain-containing protein n=1 Tax=Lentithecium fluviatile CBS 122367 TaxID=1168545 RepID=A0A6G1IR97_9PLEO|nr:hypothetical protein K458DRAFT_372755 [Lentithecium fluviatile CBS 122367]